MKKCKPSRYAVVSGSGAVTYGYRCARCGVPTKRYATRELRDERLREHREASKKKS